MYRWIDRCFLICMFIFFYHGAIYYIYPEQHYLNANASGFIPYIKIISLCFIIPFILKPSCDTTNIVWFLVGVFILLLTLPLNMFWLNDNNGLIYQLQFPIFSYFLSVYIINNVDRRGLFRFLLCLLFFSFVCIIMEYLLGGFINRYSVSGFRAVGPFINPNNTAIFSVFIMYFSLLLTNAVFFKIIIYIITAFIVILCGSKTALVLFLLSLFLNKNAFKYAFFISIVTAFFFIVSWGLDFLSFGELKVREFSLESALIRLDDFSSMFTEYLSVDISRQLFGVTNKSLVDNAYLDMINSGGIYLFCFFIFTQMFGVLITIKMKLRGFLGFNFLYSIAMLTTNIHRLWPLAYIYWIVFGILVYYSCGGRKCLKEKFY